MRRVLPLILIGLGTFLLVAALMIRFYAYPRVALAPIDQNGITKLQGLDATVFDISTLKPVTTDLSIEAKTVGDVAASKKAGGNTRVWVTTTSVRRSDDVVVSRQREQTAFDGYTAEAVNCCGNFLEADEEGDRVPQEREGLVLKFPFNTQKKDYEVWNADLQKPVTAKYIKEDTIDGLPVYVFESTVEPTVISQREVPGTLVGMKTSNMVQADQTYQSTLTYLVEPITGAPVQRSDKMLRTIGVAGKGSFTAMDATIEYTPETVSDMVKTLKGQAPGLAKLQTTIPVILGLLGLLLLLGGLFFNRKVEAAVAKQRLDEDDDF